MAKKPEIKQYKEHPSVDQRITDTLRENYMPYAMSVIVSRAIPEIDGFKPSHRKLLYTMYKMGLLNGNRTKSANIVGSTMKLNPHGDAAIDVYKRQVWLVLASRKRVPQEMEQYLPIIKRSWLMGYWYSTLFRLNRRGAFTKSLYMV